VWRAASLLLVITVARFMWAKHTMTFHSIMRRQESLPTHASDPKIEAFSIASESEGAADVRHTHRRSLTGPPCSARYAVLCLAPVPLTCAVLTPMLRTSAVLTRGMLPKARPLVHLCLCTVSQAAALPASGKRTLGYVGCPTTYCAHAEAEDGDVAGHEPGGARPQPLHH
jgi:hypothetical protein